jgi:hypothetical protein
MKKVISVLVVFVLISCGVKKTKDSSGSKSLYEVLTEQSDGANSGKSEHPIPVKESN